MHTECHLPWTVADPISIFLSILLEGMAEVTSVIKDILFYDTHEPCGLYQQHPLKCVSHAGGMR